MVQIGRYSGPGRGLSEAGANLFSGAKTKGGSLLQGIGNAIASGSGEAIDIIRDIYNTGNFAMDQAKKIPTPGDVVVDTAKYLASPSASALEEQKKQEELKLMRPFGPLQKYTPTPFDELRVEEDQGLIDSNIQKEINKLTNQKGKTKGATDSSDFELRKEEDEGLISPDTTKADATKTDAKKEEIKKQSLDNLVDSSAESFLKSLEGDDFKIRSLNEYKKDFADATGLDVSGKADKSTALMALGLALMQNKAGKGFNVSNMLSEVGKAGEAALPALEKAKSDAKQAQLAAGQYALQSRDRDTADKKSRLTELATYKRNRRDTLSDYYRQLGDQKAVDYIKHQYDKELKYIDYAQDKLTADAKGQEFKSIYQDKLLPGNEQVKVGYGFIGTEPKFINPTVDATQVTQQYIKGQRALTSLDRLDGLLASLESEQSPAGTILFDRGKSVLSALGIGKPEEWFGERGISRESEAQAIINVLIQENKRFITQETGNGVSEGDKEDIKNVLGRIELTKNPRENRLIIAELRGIFDNPMTVLENQVTSFLDDKNKYVDNQTYQNTVSEIENLLGGAQNVLQQTEFDVSE